MSSEQNKGSQNIQAVQAQAAADPEFRKRLLADPQAAVEEVAKTKLPAGLSVRVVEENPNEIVIVLASSSGRELSEAELESVAGGGSWSTCNFPCHPTEGTFALCPLK